MAKYAIIIDDIVVNIAESGYALESNWYPCSEDINIGDLLVDGVIVPKYTREDYERIERDRRLETEVDPIAGNALRWADLSPAEQLELAEYRQALLDVPNQEGFPYETVWPNKVKVEIDVAEGI
jgi:hypothetical protein